VAWVHTETSCERETRLGPAAGLSQTSTSSARAASATAINPPADLAARRRRAADRWLTGLRHPVLTTRAASAAHPALRYLQIIPVALVLWGLDDAVRFNTTASIAGMRNAPVVAQISGELGGGFVRQWDHWLVHQSILGAAASWYYVVLHGALTGLVGVWLIWRRAPHFAFHRDTLIACNVIGLLAFWFYPVAPPRMLPGYHDVTGINLPIFSNLIEGKAAAQFASLPSLHVVWALWVAVAMTCTLRTPALRALVWLYPVVTILDVLATANHYWLDVITAPAVLALAYALAAGPEYIRRHGLPRHGWPHVAARSRAHAR
jgi:hypothetical protein